MYNEYIDQLITSLKNTTINKEATTVDNYEEGMSEIVTCFSDIKNSGKKLMFIGNGGSAAIANHMTTDFMKNGHMRTCSLMEGSVLTCMGNDYGYEYVFSKQLELLGTEGDLLVAISSSGNSQNIVNAIEVARNKGMRVVTLSGFQSDNKIKAMGDINIYVPECHYGIVESVHNLILQQVVDEILELDSLK